MDFDSNDLLKLFCRKCDSCGRYAKDKDDKYTYNACKACIDVIFNNSLFKVYTKYEQSVGQPSFDCHEFDLSTYMWHKNDNNKYLCWLCVKRVVSPVRKCKHCDAQFLTGEEIIKHLITVHPKYNKIN